MPILPALPRPQRHRIHKIIHATRDKEHARRLMAILLLHEGHTATDVHHLTGWQCLSLSCRQDCHLTEAAHVVFSARFGLSAQRLGTEQINRLTGLNMAASTLRRWLPRMGIVWRRPVPTLRI